MKKRVTALFKKPENAFAVIAFIFGMGFLFAIPPLQTPDEIAHFYRSYQVATGQWSLVKGEDGKSIAWIPESIPRLTHLLAYSNPIAGDQNKEYDLKTTRAALSIKLEKDRQILRDADSAAGHPPVVYVPQAIVIAILNLFNARPLAMVYAIRVAVLIVWIVLVYCAIRVLPKRKWAAVGILLIPMVGAQSISPGVDVILLGASLLYISLILDIRKRQSQEIAKWKKLALVVSAVVMVLAKPVAACILPAVFYLGKGRIQKEKLLVAMSLILPIVMYIAWAKLLSSNAWLLPEGVSPAMQLKGVILQPWTFFVVLFNTFFFHWGDGVFSSLVGNFGPLDTPLSQPFVVIGFLLMGFYIAVSYERNDTLSNRWAVVLMLVAYFFAVCLAMYLVYSPVGFGIFYGLQGRYFSLIPIVLAVMGVAAFLSTSKRIYKKIVILGSVGMLTVSIITIVMRYYIDYNI